MLIHSAQRVGIILTAVLFIFTALSQLSFAVENPSDVNPADRFHPDSVVYENDSVFTIEGVQNELQKDGEWIKVSKDEVDPDGVTESDGFDDEINTDYVWRPYNMEEGWSPYSNGYWRYTNCGWMWVSYYNWGWRTCHYGRWWWSYKWGWVWSPGFIWGPAWVVWMYNDGYCGWYPVSPRVRCHRYYGWRCHNMRYRVRCWHFCEKKDFTVVIPPRHISDPMFNLNNVIKASVFDGNIKVVNDKVNNNGPSVKEIEEVTGKKINQVNVDKMNNTKRVNPTSKDDNNVKKVYDKDYNTDRKTDEKKYEDKRTDEKKYDNEKPREKSKDSEVKKERTYEEPRKEKPKDDYTKERKEYKEPEKKQESPKRDTKPRDGDPPKKDDSKKDDNNRNGKR